MIQFPHKDTLVSIIINKECKRNIICKDITGKVIYACSNCSIVRHRSYSNALNVFKKRYGEEELQNILFEEYL